MTEVLICYFNLLSSNKSLCLPWATLPHIVYLLLMNYFCMCVAKKKNKPNPKPGLTRHVLLHVVMSDALKIFY